MRLVDYLVKCESTYVEPNLQALKELHEQMNGIRYWYADSGEKNKKNTEMRHFVSNIR